MHKLWGISFSIAIWEYEFISKNMDWDFLVDLDFMGGKYKYATMVNCTAFQMAGSCYGAYLIVSHCKERAKKRKKNLIRAWDSTRHKKLYDFYWLEYNSKKGYLSI